MTIPWYPHHIAEYDSKTKHLSLLEHGAFRRLLDHYYATCKPLPNGTEQLLRVCLAFAPEEKQAVLKVVNEFFILEADGWHNKRADEEIERRSKIMEIRSEIGRKGGQAHAQAIAKQKLKQLDKQPVKQNGTHIHKHKEEEEKKDQEHAPSDKIARRRSRFCPATRAMTSR